MTHRGPFQPLPFCDSVITVHVSDTVLHLGGIRLSNEGSLTEKGKRHSFSYSFSKYASKDKLNSFKKVKYGNGNSRVFLFLYKHKSFATVRICIHVRQACVRLTGTPPQAMVTTELCFSLHRGLSAPAWPP